jgi:hypothetical protein
MDVLGRVEAQLNEYFAGKRNKFDLPLEPSPRRRGPWAPLTAPIRSRSSSRVTASSDRKGS